MEDDGDTYMQSSPYSMPQPEESQEEHVQSIVLAREEHLEGAYSPFMLGDHFG